MSSPQIETLSANVLPRLYRDSVALMAIASEIQKREGVIRVGAVMGTPANLQILDRSGMIPADLVAGPDDLILVVRAVDEVTTNEALEAAKVRLTSIDRGGGPQTAMAPLTVGEALAVADGVTMATISTPGTYAPIVIEQALRHGLHVFCFSDNVPVEDELRLKQIASKQRLLLMGPDCGTAIIDGIPLGFANVVAPGPVAIVAASGTGAQEISCLLDAAGTGVSQVIGVGGRDLSSAVGGLMTDLALDMVTEDEATEVVLVVSKPPAPEVAIRLLERLASLGKPVVACLLGMADADEPILVRGTLEGGAAAAAALTGHALQLAEIAATPKALRGTNTGGRILGLYTGGTLAAETRVVLGRAGLTAEVLDLGDDDYTTGRPHPMIDPAARADYVARAGSQADVGLVLLDLVLGYGASPDPATPLAEAVRTACAAATADGRDLVVVASVCGTAADPQDIDAQRAILREAGVTLVSSNAAAARYAVAWARRSSTGALVLANNLENA